MLSRIKDYLLAGLAVLVGLLAAIAMYFKSDRDSRIAKAEKENSRQVKNALDVKNTVGGMSDDDIANELHRFDRD